MDMFQTDTAPRFPGACVVCNSQTGPFVDTTGHKKWPGGAQVHVYLCERCVTAAARCFDLVPAGERDDAVTRAAELQAQLEAERLEKVIRVGDLKEYLYGGQPDVPRPTVDASDLTPTTRAQIDADAQPRDIERRTVDVPDRDAA